MNEAARPLRARKQLMSGRRNSAFAPGDSVVYPGHGVGTVTRLESQRVGEHELNLFVITFAQDRMTLRVPLHKVKSSGLRRISTPCVMEGALAKLKEPAVHSRAIWNRRALEYAAKINSGDPCLIAEVIRDLHSVAGERGPSHSQRLLYEQALGRLIQELAAIEDTQIEEATAKLELLLNAA
jgi:CarD family transcriptional regulator